MKSSRKAILKSIRTILKFGRMLEITPEKSNSITEIDFFDDKGLEDSIRLMGWTPSKKGQLIDEKKQLVKCDFCNDTLTKENITAFFPGSVKKVCDKPGCFILALDEYKER